MKSTSICRGYEFPNAGATNAREMDDAPAKIFVTHSEEETAGVARRVAAGLRGGEFISLEGDLGAGKTLFSRELARALGIAETVTSPTFVIQKIYDVHGNPHGITRLAHYDFYRISHYDELVDLGFEDTDLHTVVLAEWGNMFVRDFPVPPVRVQFEILPDDVRSIKVDGLMML